MSQVLKEDLVSDSRFYIDERNIERLLAEGNPKYYTVRSIKVGSILRKEKGERRIRTLSNTLVYAYLSDNQCIRGGV